MLSKRLDSVCMIIGLLLTGLPSFSQRAWEDIDTTGYYRKQVITRDGYTLLFINKDKNFDPATGEKMIATFFQVYPQEVKRFNPQSLRTVTFVIDSSYHGVAGTDNGVIKFDPSYFRNFPNDIDVVTHEAMHVVQNYKNDGDPGWITEGIADYARYKYGVSNASAKWSLPPYNTNQRYTDAYRVTARFFVWLEKKQGPDVVDKIDALMRSGQYAPGTWKKLYGKTVDELWEEYAFNLGI